jgi:hypothetical protein
MSGRLPALALVVFSLGLPVGCKDLRRLQEKALGLDGDDDPKAMSVSAETTGIEDLGGGTYRTRFRLTIDDEDGSLHGGSLEVSPPGGETDGAHTYPIGPDFFESWSAGDGKGYPEETCFVTGTRILAEGLHRLEPGRPRPADPVRRARRQGERGRGDPRSRGPAVRRELRMPSRSAYASASSYRYSTNDRTAPSKPWSFGSIDSIR